MQQLSGGFFGRGAAQAYEATLCDGRKPDGEQARRRSLARCRARGWALFQVGRRPDEAQGRLDKRSRGVRRPQEREDDEAIGGALDLRSASASPEAGLLQRHGLRRDHSAEVTSRWGLAEAANRGLHRTKRRDRRAGVALLVVDGQVQLAGRADVTLKADQRRRALLVLGAMFGHRVIFLVAQRPESRGILCFESTRSALTTPT